MEPHQGTEDCPSPGGVVTSPAGVAGVGSVSVGNAGRPLEPLASTRTETSLLKAGTPPALTLDISALMALAES